jgi:hypothetical protein
MATLGLNVAPRFCEVLLAIRKDLGEVLTFECSPLKNGKTAGARARAGQG